LQIGFVEKLFAGTVGVLNIALDDSDCWAKLGGAKKQLSTCARNSFRPDGGRAGR
jgi:hypothetical protein